jgi:BlaI family transcriptional regulator, penicillinase repressor
VPRRKSPTLTEAELRLMEILWAKGEATVADAVAAIPKREALAYSTVLTTMRILEQKGYVAHRQEGRAFVYRPVVDRGEARRSAVKHLLSRFFDNSPELLVLNVIEQERLDMAELERLRKLVDAPKKGGRRG